MKDLNLFLTFSTTHLSHSCPQVYCHESALVCGEARVQAALVISGQDDRVMMLAESDVTTCSRGNHLNMSVAVPNQELCKSMSVLIKQFPK